MTIWQVVHFITLTGTPVADLVANGCDFQVQVIGSQVVGSDDPAGARSMNPDAATKRGSATQGRLPSGRPTPKMTKAPDLLRDPSTDRTLHCCQEAVVAGTGFEPVTSGL